MKMSERSPITFTTRKFSYGLVNQSSIVFIATTNYTNIHSAQSKQEGLKLFLRLDVCHSFRASLKFPHFILPLHNKNTMKRDSMTERKKSSDWPVQRLTHLKKKLNQSQQKLPLELSHQPQQNLPNQPNLRRRNQMFHIQTFCNNLTQSRRN